MKQICFLFDLISFWSLCLDDDFLLYDDEDGDNRMLIYATDENLNMLQMSETWFADGTFKVVPQLFFQLYTVHALRNGYLIPCAYGLLPNKQENTYRHFFQQLCNFKQGLNPTSILTDFEQAALNALSAVFPNIQRKGCFYHFSQNIYRKI